MMWGVLSSAWTTRILTTQLPGVAEGTGTVLRIRGWPEDSTTKAFIVGGRICEDMIPGVRSFAVLSMSTYCSVRLP